MLARVLRIAALFYIAIAIFWLTFFWAQNPWAAVTGALALVSLVAPVLGVLFAVALRVNKSDLASPVSIAPTFRAWWTEVVAVVRNYFWCQAFLSTQMPDFVSGQVTASGHAGAVFIHGFICNRGIWHPWHTLMIRQRRAYAAVNLEPVLGSIENYVAVIDRAVNTVLDATGQPPILVCHSMGGLAARAWLRAQPANRQRIQQIITIGTPHHGTALAKFAFSTNGRQMRVGGAWLNQLQRDETPDVAKLFTCFYSNCDEIVFPASTATLAGADNRLIVGAPHLGLAFHPDVMAATLGLLRAHQPD